MRLRAGAEGSRTRPTQQAGQAPRARPPGPGSWGGRGSNAAPCPTGKIRTGGADPGKQAGSLRPHGLPAPSPAAYQPGAGAATAQPAGQEGRLMRGASRPPAPPGHPLRARTKAAGRTPRECPARHPLARFPTEAPAPPCDPRPRVLPGAQGPVRGRDPGSPAALASLAGPLPRAQRSSAPGVYPPGHYCHQTWGDWRALAPGSL